MPPFRGPFQGMPGGGLPRAPMGVPANMGQFTGRPMGFGAPGRFPVQAGNASRGGFLSKLLGGLNGGQGQAAGFAARPGMFGAMNPQAGQFANTLAGGQQAAGGSGMLSNLVSGASAANGGGVMSTLSNVQNALNMAQSAMPLVQQYGPMVKNIPALWQMMKTFNSSGEEDETDILDSSEEEEDEDESLDFLESDEDISSEKENKKKPPKEDKKKIPIKKEKKPSRPKEPVKEKASVPKLYI